MKSLSERFPEVYFGDESRIFIGKNVNIQPGSLIGATPMMTYIEDMKEKILPVKGNIIIDNDVTIGSHAVINFGCGPTTEISSGVMGRNTVIGEGSFIWHHSNIGHDVVIGKHTKIGAFACIAGGCEIGEWTYFAIGSMSNPSLKIGDLVLVGSKALVTKDLPSKIKVKGIPARKFGDNTWRPDGWTEEDEMI